MLKKIIPSVLLFALGFTLCACTGSKTEPQTTGAPAESVVSTAESVPDDIRKDGEITDSSKEYSILFIGNSYTFYNDMPEEIFAPLSEAAGYSFKVKSITAPSWTMAGWADPEDENGKLLYTELAENKYDYIVIQDQSTQPLKDIGRFYDGVRSVTKMARENGAVPLFYCTWGRHDGHAVLENYGVTTESMTWKVAAAYKAIGEELGVAVANVGMAFFDVYTSGERGCDIYHNDLSHPSPKGSYLAAMTIFAELTGVDPTTVDYKGSCPAPVAEILKEAARDAVFETPEIPEEYRTASEGIHTSKEESVPETGE